MSAIRETGRSSTLDAVTPLLAAAATAALAVCAHDWAVGHVTGEVGANPVRMAAVVGLSAILGGTRLPFLVRVALHLGTLWILQRYVGTDSIETPVSGFFFVSTAAFFGGAAMSICSARSGRRMDLEDERRSLGTGDLIAALFAFSAYVAVGQHAAQFWNVLSDRLWQSAVLYALLPYMALNLLEALLGRTLAAVSLGLAAVAVMIVLPEFPLVDPFATALIVAIRIVGRPFETADSQTSSVLEPLRTPVPPAA